MNPDDFPGNPDYLAKDFNSFRTLMFDHLSLVAPDWVERHAADVGIALVEVLAYVGDYLSYYQDAVAAEAYLATARQRASVRRHARLVDHRLDEGCCARVWVQLTPASDGVLVAKGTPLLTRIDGMGATVSAETYKAYTGEVFETMHDAVLRRAHASMQLALRDTLSRSGMTQATIAGTVDVQPGLVLLVRHVESGLCHPVRLCAVTAQGQSTLIEWHAHDALPVDLPTGGTWVAHGNMVLADHGRTSLQVLPPVPSMGSYSPAIACAELSFTLPYDHVAAQHTAAARLFLQDPGDAEPAITLRELPQFAVSTSFLSRPDWTAQRDLIHACSSDRCFAAEPDGTGIVRLRFGDGTNGRRPQPDWQYQATLRTGIGARGNIGPEALNHIVTDDDRIIEVGNWLAAAGGSDPETLTHARAAVPLTRAIPRRCVIADDYRGMVARFPGVASVRVARQWHEGQPTVSIRVQRAGGRSVDRQFVADLHDWLAPVRLIGDTLEIGAEL